MDETPHTTRERNRESAIEHRGATERSHRDGPELRLAVVEYSDGPDRGTIHPPDSAGIERMETWLSANLSAFVDLRAWR